MTARHVILAAGILLLLGFVLSLCTPLSGLFPMTTTPVPPGELWEMNHR